LFVLLFLTAIEKIRIPLNIPRPAKLVAPGTCNAFKTKKRNSKLKTQDQRGREVFLEIKIIKRGILIRV